MTKVSIFLKISSSFFKYQKVVANIFVLIILVLFFIPVLYFTTFSNGTLA